MSLLFIPQGEDAPRAREVLWTWVLWLPIAGMCFYVAWGYGAADVEGDALTGSLQVVVASTGVAILVRSVVKTLRWRRKVAEYKVAEY